MKRILVALDGSPRAPAVLDAAATLARGIDAQLVLLRVVTIPVELGPELFVVSPSELEELLIEGSRRELVEIGQRVKPELIAGVRVELGVPWQTICNVAREEDAVAVVIGSHGYRLLDRVLGTTAAKVVNHADRSVLVVRGVEGVASAGA